jgi:hypothetical protein
MREYLDTPKPGVIVIAQLDNTGPSSIFSNPTSFALLPQLFCVTDPDLLFNPECPTILWLNWPR